MAQAPHARRLRWARRTRVPAAGGRLRPSPRAQAATPARKRSISVARMTGVSSIG